MRTFIGIPMAKENKMTLATLQERCQSYCKKGKFTVPENFHMTLHFLGETTVEDLEALKMAVLETAVRNRAFSMKLQGIGVFQRGETGVLWAGVEKNSSLFRLFEGLERNLTRQGFSRERKGLQPHITLGREVVPYQSFQKLKKEIVVPQEEIAVEEIVLFESVRLGRKLEYRPLFVAKLKNGNKK